MQKEKGHLKEWKELLKPPPLGTVIEGEVISTQHQKVLVEIPSFKTGVLSFDDLKKGGLSPKKIKPGDKILVKIIKYDDHLPEVYPGEGYLSLSFFEAKEEKKLEKIKELIEKKEVLTLKPFSATRGGLLFNLFGTQGFLPISKIKEENFPRLENPNLDEIKKNLQKLVGKEIKVRIIKIKNGKLILEEA